MATTCQRCRKDNQPGTRFCDHCGFDMNVGITVQTPPGYPTPGYPTPGDPTLTSVGSGIAEDPLIGKEVGGCIIETKIGQGGMGAVYRGTQISLNRPVAIKILPEHLAKNATYIARFLRESEIVASIRNPNIVAVYDRGRVGSVYFFVMEFIEGRTVADLIAEHGPIGPGDALEIALQATKALAAAATLGIIHRDIKPDNIMIDRGGLVKVTDFGLVKNTTETTGGITGTHQVMGTPAFMSPEQCQGAIVDHRSDIYSLGMTFYSLLVGEPAFKGETSMAIMYKHIHEPPQPVHHRNKDLPKSIWPVMSKMLAKDPAERYATWQTVLVAFSMLSRNNPAQFATTDLLALSSSKRFPAVTDMTPRPTPTAEPHTLKVESPVRTPPPAQPGYSPTPVHEMPTVTPTPIQQPPGPAYTAAPVSPAISEQAPYKKGLLLALVIVIVIAVAVGSYSIWFRPPDKSAEVKLAWPEIENDLKAGRLDAADTKYQDIFRKFGQNKNRDTKSELRFIEERYNKLKPLYEKYEKLTNEVRCLKEKGKLNEARILLQTAKKEMPEADIKKYLEDAIKDFEEKMRQKVAKILSEAEQYGNRGRWQDALNHLETVKTNAVEETIAAKVRQAISDAKKAKEVAEEQQREKEFSKNVDDAKKALDKRDLELLKALVSKLTASKPKDETAKQLADRMRLETLEEIPETTTIHKGVEVNVPGYQIGAFEVTNLQFGEFVVDKGYSNQSYWTDEGWYWKKRAKVKVMQPKFWDDERFKAPKQPVVGISWHEAEAYCAWLSAKSGKKYRLPIVPEWELAADGPPGTDWPWGDDTEDPPANLRGTGKGWTSKVGEFDGGKSRVGCYDMIGNAAEWCSAGSAHCVRGGSWLTGLGRVKADSDCIIPPETRTYRIGFRCVREIN